MSKNESIMAIKPEFQKQVAFTFVAKVMDFCAAGSVPARGPSPPVPVTHLAVFN